MKREIALEAIVLRSSKGKFYAVFRFRLGKSIINTVKFPSGGKLFFSVPCKGMNINQPVTIQNLLRRIKEGAEKFKIPFEDIENLERYKRLASGG